MKFMLAIVLKDILQLEKNVLAFDKPLDRR